MCRFEQYYSLGDFQILDIFWSVSRFQEKEKRGEIITINDNKK
jgi:hypothetical protein